MHSKIGKVVSIDEHHSGKHATITVRHGKRKRLKGEKDGETGALMSYDQPESRIHVSKADAANYKLGQKVNAGIEASDANDDDMDYGDEDAQNGAASSAKAIPGKQSGVTSVKPSKGKSKIFAAMKAKKK